MRPSYEYSPFDMLQQDTYLNVSITNDVSYKGERPMLWYKKRERNKKSHHFSCHLKIKKFSDAA